LLVDVGSTVVKVCTHEPGRGFGPVRIQARRPGVAPGVQARTVIAQRRTDVDAVRVCSSANGGVRVGILGLSGRHSMAAAARATTASGGNVSYQRLLGAGGTHEPPVDLLVLAGGVDGADHRYLRAALAATTLEDFPHDVLVWAGAAAGDIVAGLAVDHVVPNVLDERLRPATDGMGCPT
jgi:hypothetical protein